jgi:hypothetical protein
MIDQVGDPTILKGTTSAQPGWTGVPILNKRGQPTFAKVITVRNEDATNALNVSLDGGATFITIPQGDVTGREFDGPLISFAVQSGGGAASTADWSAIASVG